LEFLIKDYSIEKNPEDSEKIEKVLLAKVIEKYVDDVRIKTVSKRAVWIGNDETHYIRKWEGKNLEDLKKLIDLTIHWIEMETLTSSFAIDMPEK
jgi:predicted PilT family ATPase